MLLSPDHAHAKIGDFGLTSHLGAYSTLTSNAGTPLWSAPEVQIGARAYDERCDIYSYAILILEIFDFRYVHGELLQKEVVRRLVSGWRPDTLALRHVRLLWLVHACWAADPASRPPFERIVKLLDGSAEARAGSMEDLVDAHQPSSSPRKASSRFSPFNLIDRITVPPVAPVSAYSHLSSTMSASQCDSACDADDGADADEGGSPAPALPSMTT